MTSFTDFNLITIKDIEELERKNIQPTLLSFELIENYEKLNPNEISNIVKWIESKLQYNFRFHKLFENIAIKQHEYKLDDMKKLHNNYTILLQNNPRMLEYIKQHSSFNCNVNELLIEYFQKKVCISQMNSDELLQDEITRLDQNNFKVITRKNLESLIKQGFRYETISNIVIINYENISTIDQRDVFGWLSYHVTKELQIRLFAGKYTIFQQIAAMKIVREEILASNVIYAQCVMNDEETKKLAQCIFDLDKTKFTCFKVEYLDSLLDQGFDKSILSNLVIVCNRHISEEDFPAISAWLLEIPDRHYSTHEMLRHKASDLLHGKDGYLYQSFKDSVGDLIPENNNKISSQIPSQPPRRTQPILDLSNEEIAFIYQTENDISMNSVDPLSPDVLESVFILDLQLEQDDLNHSFRNSLMKLLNDKSQYNSRFIIDCIVGGHINLLKVCLDSTNERYNNYISMLETMIKVVKSTHYEDFEVKLKLIKFALNYEEYLKKCVIESLNSEKKTSIQEIMEATKIRNYILMNLCSSKEELGLVKIALGKDPTVKIEALILKYNSVNA